MYKSFQIFTFIFLLCPLLEAQQITEIRADFDKPKRIINITYNLLADNKLQEKQVFDIDVYVSLDNGLTYSPALEYIRGSVKSVSPGINNKIVWNYYPEMPDLNGEKVIFKLVGKLNNREEEKRILKLGTANSAWQSLVLPGWGSSQVRGTKNKGWIGLGAYGLVGTGIYLKLSSDKQYKDYQTVQSPELAASTLDKAKQQQMLSQILLIGGGAIWISDIAYTIIKGNRNDKMQKEILNRKRDLSFQWYGMGAGLVVKF